MGTGFCSTGASTMGSGLSSVSWHLEVYVTCRSTGGSGTVVAAGVFENNEGTVFSLVKTSTTTIDTTAANLLQVTGTWGTASASNTITCQEATIEELAIDDLAAVGPSGLTATETV